MPTPTEAKRAFDSVYAMLVSGRIAEAEKACRESLRLGPDDVNLLGLLGAILLKRDQTSEAESVLRRTIKLEPAFARPHEDLGALYLRLDRPDQAIPCFEAAIKLDSHQPSALLGLATALARTGRQSEADAVHKRFLEMSPDGRSLADAARLRQEGHADRAEKICGDLLSKDPNNLRALRLLAKISSDKGRYTAAEGLLRRVLQIAPDFYLGYSDLGEFFAERSRFHDAVDMFEQALDRQTGSADMHRMLADTLFVVNRPEDALVAYRRCLDLAPGHLAALMGLGHMQRIVGQQDAAVASYRQCIKLQPAFGDAWWNLASIRGYRFSATERERMRALLESAETEEHAKIALHFALARDCEADGKFDEAWEHYSQGNVAKRRSVKYDPVEIEMQNDARIKVFSHEMLQRLQSRASTDITPVFIVGMPRAGSTLVEQILASHSGVEGCGELPYIIMQSAMLGSSEADGIRYPEIIDATEPEELRKLGEDYLGHSAVHRRADRAFFTDKMPSNFMHIGFIHLILPQAVIIDARRDPLDTCVGNFRQLFAQGKNQSYDLHELGEYYLQYLRIMEHWDRILPGRVLKVQYEDVVSDLEAQVRRILRHCGLEFEAACLDFHASSRPVNTASSEQVRQPIYTDAVGFWKHYESHLTELKQILAPVLQ
jgi:tetratricopeptide (TPR) repeat protein